jgi:hypothetical protein
VPLPRNVATHLYRGGSWALPGSDDAACEGAKFHSPTPMFTHPVRLIPPEWSASISAIHSPLVHLCGVCRDNLTILQQMVAATAGDLDWAVRREFGNEIRALAFRGWAIYTAVRSGVDPQQGGEPVQVVGR